MNAENTAVQEQIRNDKMQEVLQAYISGNTAEALRLYDLYFEDELLELKICRKEGVSGRTTL